MIDYICTNNYKILSDEELLDWKKFTEQKIKEYKNRLLNINRAIRKRGIK